MKKIIVLFITLSAQMFYPQSLTDFRFSCGGNTVSNNEFTIYSRMGEELVGIAKNDMYTMYIGSIYNFEKIFLTGVTEEDSDLPIATKLFQNYPNPFNPITTINYQIPVGGYVSLKIFDLLGREVLLLVNEEKLPGNYKVILNGQNLASGVYFYQIRFGNFVDTKKLLLMK